MGRHSAPEEPEDTVPADTVPEDIRENALPEATAPEGPEEAPAGRPALRVVRGEPTADELAVVTAVIAAASRGGDSGPGAEQVPPRNRWADPFDVHQRPWLHGVGGWRTSLRG